MANFYLTIHGEDAEYAADLIESVLRDGQQVDAISRSIGASHSGVGEKVMDPISLAAVVLAIPGSILAAADIVDRIRKRRMAENLVSAAKRLRTEKGVTITIGTPDGTNASLDELQVDAVLEIAERSGTAN